MLVIDKTIKILDLFRKLGDPNYTPTQQHIDAVFAKNFVMIAHNKLVCRYDGLIKHFKHILQQVSKVNFVVH